MAMPAPEGQLPIDDALTEPRKKKPRDLTKAQRGHGRDDDANDGTEVLAIVADIEFPDGRRACEARHGSTSAPCAV